MKFELPPPIPPKPEARHKIPRAQGHVPAAKPEPSPPASLHPGEGTFGDDSLSQAGREQKQATIPASSAAVPAQASATASPASSPLESAPGAPQTRSVWVGVGILLGIVSLAVVVFVIVVFAVAIVMQPAPQNDTRASSGSAVVNPAIAPEPAPTSSAANSAPYSMPTSSPSPSDFGWDTSLANVETRRAAPAAPTSTPSAVYPTIAPTPVPRTYQVVTLQRGESLTVRKGPGVNYASVVRLPGGLGGIILGEGRFNNNGTIWQEIFVGGSTGYVNEIYLKEQFVIR